MKKAKQDKTMTLIHGNPTGRKNIGKKKKAGVVKVTEGALEREREREREQERRQNWDILAYRAPFYTSGTLKNLLC
ncbi:hypothetical protein [Candidatus Magnetobacterium casense]|uniref:hypothetical protein n=1 Tax=Candidatus Magnetobacterium casense TaxID=1455061 RepID=UPI0012DC350D|nr:hypothetical protein [Candidatus Magnetobacterium casensis]